MSQIEGTGSAAQIGYIGSTMYKQAEWLRMMAVAFKEADKQRQALVRNGPWTVRTDSIERFSRFETYA